MSSQPPPIPLKYKVAASPDPPAPKRVFVAPPRKSGPSFWETLFRVVIVFVILLSLGMAYWSFFHRLLPLQQQARAIVSTVSKLSSDLDALERRWTPGQAEEIRARYREVYAQLFANQAQLEEWLGQLQSQAAPLKLDVSVGFGESVPQHGFDANLAIVPASISLEVRPAPDDASGKSPYDRVLAFGETLASHGKRADLAEITVVGGPDSISRTLLVFNLWAGDLGAEATMASTNTTNKQEAK